MEEANAQCNAIGNDDGEQGCGGYPCIDSSKSTLFEWICKRCIPLTRMKFSGPIGYETKKWVSI